MVDGTTPYHKPFSNTSIDDFILKTYTVSTLFKGLYHFNNLAINEPDQSDPWVISIINTTFPSDVIYGKCYYKLKYVISGLNITTFKESYEFGPGSN